MVRKAMLCVLLIAGCMQKSQETPSASATPAPRPVQASTIPAPAPEAAVDLLGDEYRQADAIIRAWEGDKAQLEDAKNRFMSIVAKDKSYALAYVGLANVEYRMGFKYENSYEPDSLQRAWKFAQHALKLNPELYEGHMVSGWIQRYEGDWDAARESANAAEKIRPGQAATLLLRAELGETSDDPRDTVKYAKEALNVAQDARDRAAAYGYLIDAYEFGSHLQEAQAAYEEQLKLVPDSSMAHARYSALLLARDDVDGAVREAEKAVSLFKSPFATAVLAESYLKKAQILWDESKIQESATIVAKIAELPGDNARVSYALGRFYENAAVRSRDKSMRKKALDSYRKAANLQPGWTEATQAVERLEKSVG
jgi:tetratricopeptide (TPR) repeat protein